VTGPRVLVVDDEPAVRFTLEEALGSGGFEVVSAASGSEALERLDGVRAVLTDLVMPGPGGDGLALAARLRELDADLPVILLTARGSEATAVQAMKAGVFDYLTKPFVLDELRLVVARAVEAHDLRRARSDLALQRVLGPPATIVGEAPAFRALMQQVRRVGRHDVTVLVRGETGTGKELIAAALHAESPRRAGPFVRFNCAAIPAELAEAELFGHARGAFTGATADRRGFFAQAHGGTLVLDEVGELPLPLQASLLRALASGEIQRVGTSRIEKVDVRVVAATNRDLTAEVAAGRFRQDLYYRLAVVELVVPPLRERREDLPALIEALRQRLSLRLALEAPVHFSPALVTALCSREWPGNVRELENAIARLLTLAEGGELGPAALQAPSSPPADRPADPSAPLRVQLDAFERDLLARTLAACGGNQSEAARRLGITRTTLLDKLKRHGLHRA
jgi:DNA-binding NtrC family response regulator